MPIFDWKISPGFTPAICLPRNFVYIWVRSRNCGCLVTWFCSHLIAKPGNKTATVSWPDPYQLWRTGETNPLGKTSKKLFWIVIPTFGKSYHKLKTLTARPQKLKLGWILKQIFQDGGRPTCTWMLSGKQGSHPGRVLLLCWVILDVPPFWPPFLTFWGLNMILLGYFFSSTDTKTIFWGT